MLISTCRSGWTHFKCPYEKLKRVICQSQVRHHCSDYTVEYTSENTGEITHTKLHFNFVPTTNKTKLIAYVKHDLNISPTLCTQPHCFSNLLHEILNKTMQSR